MSGSPENFLEKDDVPPEANCSYCGKPIILTRKKRANLRSGHTKRPFCNHACYSKAINTREDVTCPNCEKKFMPTGSQWWWFTKGPNKLLFCSNKCVGEYYRGSRNAKWRGGKICDGRYVRIRVLEHPAAHTDGYVLEHRFVMEGLLGRYLLPEEVVHHINGDGTDNRPENLMLFASEAEHQKFHAEIRKNQKEAKPKHKCLICGVDFVLSKHQRLRLKWGKQKKAYCSLRCSVDSHKKYKPEVSADERTA